MASLLMAPDAKMRRRGSDSTGVVGVDQAGASLSVRREACRLPAVQPDAAHVRARRRLIVVAVLVALDALDFAFTIHDHLTYRPGRDGPLVMPIGQLLGWVTSVVLLLILATMAVNAMRRHRERRRWSHPPRA
jgi:ethanolamine transporter EutH